MESLGQEISLLIGRMDAKLDILLTRSDSHEIRIGNLENQANSQRGSLKTAIYLTGAVGGIAAAILPFLFKMIH